MGLNLGLSNLQITRREVRWFTFFVWVSLGKWSDSLRNQRNSSSFQQHYSATNFSTSYLPPPPGKKTQHPYNTQWSPPSHAHANQRWMQWQIPMSRRSPIHVDPWPGRAVEPFHRHQDATGSGPTHFLGGKYPSEMTKRLISEYEINILSWITGCTYFMVFNLRRFIPVGSYK